MNIECAHNVDFHAQCKIRVKFIFPVCGYPVFPISFIVETTLSPLYILGVFVKLWLTVDM